MLKFYNENKKVEIEEAFSLEPTKRPTERRSKQSKSELDQSKNISDDETSKSQDENKKDKAVKSKKTKQQDKGKSEIYF